MVVSVTVSAIALAITSAIAPAISLILVFGYILIP